jgi:molybdopterin synthase sulfur carrier subunit
MATVWIPALLRDFTQGQPQVEVPGNTVRQVIESLDTAYPGLKGRLCDGDQLVRGIAVSIDGHLAPLGLLARVGTKSEIHFLPLVGGGMIALPH